jgi:hypothetical protein
MTMAQASSVPPTPAPDRVRLPSPRMQVLQTSGLFIYYLSILVALLWIYGRGDVPTAPFIYQGF